MSSVGKLVLILGPSGSGKGTVLGFLKERHPEFVFPISCTTRPKRPNEVEGEVYDFVSHEEFKEKIEAGDFLEYAYVHDRDYYGTLKGPIMNALAAGKVVIREVDVQGVRSIRDLLPSDQVVTIFLSADWEKLKERILNRAPMSDEELKDRQESFMKEMAWQEECDYVIESVEGQIQEVCEEVESTILNATSS